MLKLIPSVVIFLTVTIVCLQARTESEKTTRVPILNETNKALEMQKRKAQSRRANQLEHRLKKRQSIKDKLELPAEEDPYQLLRKGKRVFIPAEIVGRETPNIQRVLREIRIAPYTRPDGRQDGYRLQSIGKGSLAQALGFEVGDVIQQINHRKTTSMSAIYKAFKRTKESKLTSIDIRFLRKGRPSSIIIIKK